MENLLDTSDCSQIVARIEKLAPASQRQWGRMDVAQMLTHVHRGLQSAAGELKLKRTLLGFLLGGLVKKKMLGEKPWKQNMPTDKRFTVADARDFAAEKEALLQSVRRFSTSGEAGVSKDPHPFFGPLTPQEWGRLMWKHLDHHLRQFGA